MRVGILAIQGSFSLHKQVLSNLGVEPVEVRTAEHLSGIDTIILPGGESTTFHKLLSESDLGDPLQRLIRAGMPVWGTCAGAIILGRGEGRPQPRWGFIDIEVTRNAYGRQVDSFVAPLDISGLDGQFPGVFIRAPRFSRAGADVELLAQLDGKPVMARQGTVLVTAFHPELTSDYRIHRYFLENICPGSGEERYRPAV